ncbi:hypothetical protein I8751_00045 [Nostocaceae cyanobacterium CENA357]|uniref:Cell division protein FtsL n=1 Tax=Atlanticothrix silvestris CENA357 TaxID=1725252 RepID=A0A8J7HDX2_9CYAN|nr:hypothetical protein [Atlanticothrix silvestris]MBH8550806.1 hypothetical protein [Atlanticothrix silvestris CENA357]
MAAARKRDYTPSVEKRRSVRLGSATRSVSTLATENSFLSSLKQQRSEKKLSFPTTRGTQDLSKRTVSNLQEHSNTAQKRLETGSHPLPTVSPSKAAPLWLLRLYNLHQYSSVVAFFLVAATLVVYGWTVYSQELWGQDYRRLQNLQRNERQLTTTNATLTNKMAEEAERPTAGLVSPTPAKTIFLPPASHGSNPKPSNGTPKSETQQYIPSPLGY